MAENELAAPPFPMMETEQPRMTASRRLAFMAWDKAIRPGVDPTAETLTEETKARIEFFAREVRNATIEQLAGAVKRFMEKNAANAYDSLMSLKE